MAHSQLSRLERRNRTGVFRNVPCLSPFFYPILFINAETLVLFLFAHLLCLFALSTVNRCIQKGKTKEKACHLTKKNIFNHFGEKIDQGLKMSLFCLYNSMYSTVKLLKVIISEKSTHSKTSLTNTVSNINQKRR